MYHIMYSTRYSFQILGKLEFSGQIFEKYSAITFYECPPSGAQLFHADRQTDRQM